MGDRIRVTAVIEVEADRVLFGGTRLRDNERVSFHVRMGEGVKLMIEKVRAGKEVVEVEL